MPTLVRFATAPQRGLHVGRSGTTGRFCSVVALSVLVAVASVGCSLDVSNPSSEAAWTAMVDPDPSSVVSFFAQVAMTSNSGETLISIAFAESAPSHRFDWAIRYGTCEEPEEYISFNPQAFPPITIGLDGSAELLVFLELNLSSNFEYSVVIFDDLSGQTLDQVGCAVMEIVEDDN